MNPPLDRDLLHKYLWKKANARGQLLLVMRDLAEELMLPRSTVSRILIEMAQEGRCRRLSRTAARGPFTWQIYDPDSWAQRPGPQRHRR